MIYFYIFLYILGIIFLICIIFELENVGKGPAINTRIGFNKSSVTKNERKYIKPENLKVGDFFYINIYIQNITDSVIGEYVLEVNYFDIYGNNYSQENKN